METTTTTMAVERDKEAGKEGEEGKATVIPNTQGTENGKTKQPRKKMIQKVIRIEIKMKTKKGGPTNTGKALKGLIGTLLKTNDDSIYFTNDDNTGEFRTMEGYPTTETETATYPNLRPRLALAALKLQQSSQTYHPQTMSPK